MFHSSLQAQKQSGKVRREKSLIHFPIFLPGWHIILLREPEIFKFQVADVMFILTLVEDSSPSLKTEKTKLSGLHKAKLVHVVKWLRHHHHV